jgi:hypothetical protein
MKVPTFIDQTYIVESSDARLRRADNLAEAETYQAGDAMPAGSVVGDVKRLPKGTQIKVSDIKTDADRFIYVFATPVGGNGLIPSGWTKAGNLEGKLFNELIGFAPAEWDCSPAGDNFTVTDKQAIIRGGAPNFASLGKTIPVGSYVVVTEKAQANGKSFVKICRAETAGGQITKKEELGWTSAVNLTDGCAKFFASAAWLDQKGANACWRKGAYIGTKILVNIVGIEKHKLEPQLEQITLESVAPYFALRDAAAQAGLQLIIESGFRTYPHQARLYDLYLQKKGATAAKPGRSNHQHGQAFDFNTFGFDGDPLYDWLKKNAPRMGFLRTVNGEHWHWEYLPEEAAQAVKKGTFKNFSGGL